MGRLFNLETEQITCLKSWHVFGRDLNVSDTPLYSSLCSRLQCIISFNNNNWIITDKSKNGSYLNHKLISDENRPLSIGDHIGFSENKMQWKVIDASYPKPMLYNAHSYESIELDSINILPRESKPELLLTQQGQGWIVEQGNQIYSISGGDSVCFNGIEWTLFPNDLVQQTITHRLNKKISEPGKLVFKISLNEENVHLQMNIKNTQFDMGYKSHHQILLYLARYKLSDKKNNLPYNERGWVATDLLLLELGIQANNLNILIYRLRKAFAQIDYPGNIIERRQGEIRLAHCNFSLSKGDDFYQYLESDLLELPD